MGQSAAAGLLAAIILVAAVLVGSGSNTQTEQSNLAPQSSVVYPTLNTSQTHTSETPSNPSRITIIHPAQTPNPTPTGEPKVTYTGTNKAPLSTFMASVNDYPANFELITSGVYTHNGNNSIRVHTNNVWMEADGPFNIAVKAGDHIYFEVWCKTGPGTMTNSPYDGGRIGIDYYVAGGVARYPDGSAPGKPLGSENGLPYSQKTFIIPWNTDWTLLFYDVTVPTEYYSWHEENIGGVSTNVANAPAQINLAVPWFDVREDADNGNAYFSEPVFYVNPDTGVNPPPPIEPPPTQYYYVTTSADTGGSVNPVKNNFAVPVGQSFTVTAQASSNYTFGFWTRNNVVQQGTSPTYTMSDGNANVQYNIVANFSYTPPTPQTFTVNISSTLGGYTTPMGTQVSNVGVPVSISATASAGYSFTNFKRNGTVYSTNTPIVISGSANQTITIQAVFTQDPVPPPPPSPTYFSVNIGISEGGSTNLTGIQTVLTTDSLNVTATPDANYTLAPWTKDGVAAGTANPINITGTASQQITLQPNFTYVPPATSTYTVTVLPTTGGATDKNGVNTVPVGTVFAITETPNSSNYFDQWFLDNANAGNAKTLTLPHEPWIVQEWQPQTWVDGLWLDLPAASGYSVQAIFKANPPSPPGPVPLGSISHESTHLQAIFKILENTKVPTIDEIFKMLEKAGFANG